MLPSRLLCSLLVVSSALAPLAHGSEDSQTRHPGFFSRVLDTLNPFNDGPRKEKARKQPNWKKLALNILVEPSPLKLSETRQMTVRLQLSNTSRRFVQLDFPTTQRIEVLVRNKMGKLVEQWSEDQRFEADPSVVTINPGERLEYTASIATRDFTPGESYAVEGFFPNYETLRIQKTIVPEK